MDKVNNGSKITSDIYFLIGSNGLFSLIFSYEEKRYIDKYLNA